MNTKLLLAGLLLPLACLSQSGGFTIKGKVGQLNEPAMAILRYTIDQKNITDSVLLKDGNFELKGTINHPVKASLMLLHEGRTNARLRNVDALSFYLEKATIKINSDDSVKYAVIKGSKINKDNQKLKVALQASTDKNKALMDAYNALPNEQKKDKAVGEEINAKLNEIYKEQNEVNRSFIMKNPHSYVSFDVLKGYNYGGYSAEYEELAPLFNSLSDEFKKSPDGVAYEQRLQKLKETAIGEVAPEFIQNDVNGNPVSLSSFRGKYVLLDFWASWCGPCRAENPNVVKTYQEYKNKDFTILGVSLDQPNAKDKWIKAIADDHLEWTQVSDLQFWNNEVAKKYGVNAIPQNFLLDPSGKIVGKNLRSSNLKSKLGELIK